MTKRTTIYLNPPLAAAIEGCDSISGRLGTLCDRYAEIIRRTRVASRFTEAELNALRDCCNGTWFEPAQLIDGAIRANFDDSLPDGLADKWDVDPDKVRAKLDALTYADQVALVENIEKFWRTTARDNSAGSQLHAEPEKE